MSLARSRGIRLAVFGFSLLLVGCHSQPSANTAPTITFTKIPPAAEGGREKTDTISGRVEGAHPGQQIVVYARSGPWWVQPWPEQPLIPIQSDSTWTTPTHLGYEYAALLVDAGYKPPPTMDIAPSPGGSVIKVEIVKGTGTVQYARTVPLSFSGYDWKVRTISADRGGLNNLYDPDNAWIDATGALHLRIKKRGDRWTCAQIEMPRPLGYGTYSFVVRDVSHLEPAAVLSVNTFDNFGGDQNYRELDVEVSQWGDAGNKNNAQVGIQPFYVPGNLERFVTPSGKVTYSFHWQSGRADFKIVRGAGMREGGPVVFQHSFTSGVPTPGDAVLQMAHYVVASDKTPLQKDSEIVIEKFEYLP